MEGEVQSNNSPVENDTNKKRKKLGRISEANKKLNLRSYNMGENYNCILLVNKSLHSKRLQISGFS